MATDIRRIPGAIGVLGLLIATITNVTLAINCNSGFYQIGRQCIPCPPGFFQDKPNQTSCKPCQAGLFAPFPGSFTESHCLRCVSGTFSREGSSRCIPCPRGTVSGVRASECEVCAPGYGLTGNGCYRCDDGYFNDGSMKFCALCPSGMRTNKPRAATSCVKCPPGTFRDSRFISFSPETKCFPCLRTTYSDQEGTEQCKLCPLGTVSERGFTKCTSCPAGTYRGNVKHRNCRPCPPGTFSKGLSPARCKHPLKGCPWGTFEDASGECRACMPGEKLDAARKVCVPCAENEVSPGGATTTCTQCPSGKEPASSVTVYEKSFCQCKLGTTEAEDGSCQKCAAGRYGLHTGPGTKWSTLRRSWDKRKPGCTECDDGTYSREGTTRCEICPEGTISTRDHKSCKKCPPGTRNNPALIYYEGARINFQAPPFCQTLRDDCRYGEVRDRQGRCNVRFCEVGKILSPARQCISCDFPQRFNPATRSCDSCPTGTGNIEPHLSTTCTACPKNADRRFEDGACQCLNSFIMVGGQCVWCGPEKVAVNNKCESCKEGVPIEDSGITACTKCVGRQYQATPDSKTCTKCPKGYIRSRNVLGEVTEGCMPNGRYI